MGGGFEWGALGLGWGFGERDEAVEDVGVPGPCAVWFLVPINRVM